MRPFARTRLVVLAAALSFASPAAAATGDAEALRLAGETLTAMGGREGWDATRFFRWNFAQKRLHHWDKLTGDLRLEADSLLVLLNVNTREGRSWLHGEEVEEAETRAKHLEFGYSAWINDSYWLAMPYKLLDDGVILRYRGESAMEDGRAADLLTMTFDSVGVTPQNKYDVWIARDTGLVSQWAYYPTAGDEEPRFVRPWAGWRPFGRILLPTDHGREDDPWGIEVPEELPRSLFEVP